VAAVGKVLQVMATLAVATLSLVGIIVLGFGLCALLIGAWALFLDVVEQREHSPAKVRAAMFSILFAAMMCESAFLFCGFTHRWVIVVSLLVNLWGWLDALLRFPVVHDVQSVFTAKQFLLLVLKTLSYAFGIIGLSDHIGKFLLLVMINIWGMPVLYLMALPLHDYAEPDERDVDLVLRVWQFTTCKTDRQQCLRTCKNWLHRRLFDVSLRCDSPTVRSAVCAASPVCRRAFSKGCRSV